MSEHNEQHGWHRFADQWPTPADCDIYGNVEVAGSGSRAFCTLASMEMATYNLKRACWWRTPSPLPYIT
jgi:hypothetical protein